MTPHSEHRSEHREQSRLPGWQRVLLMSLLALLAIYSLSVILDVGRAGMERGFNPLIWLLVSLAAITAAASAFAFFRMLRTGRAEPEAESIRRSRNWIWASFALGALLGLALSAGIMGDDTAVFSNAPLPPALAIATMAWLSVVVPFISWRWYRNVDEHERQSYNFGALAALYFYTCLTPGWWLGWRGGFLPEPAHMLVFLATMFIWCAGWFWRRYR